MDNTDKPKIFQTVMLARVIPGDTHEEAVEELRRLLGIIGADAETAGDKEMVSFVDECWMPNDCPNSEYPVLWAHEVTGADLIRAHMCRLADGPMSMHRLKYAEVRKGEPALGMWEADIDDSAALAAEQVLPIAYGGRQPTPKAPQ